jgi:tRNA-2-methylthio-N6-dimethylallyladenosine synthase
MENQCDPEEVKSNFDMLLKEVQQISTRKAQALEGQTLEVLAEQQNEQDASLLTGRLSNNSVVHFPGTPDMIGRLFMVKLTECKGFYYLGEIAGDA